MKFGIREAVDVVFKATADVTIGSTEFLKGEPVLYFDTLKTSTTEGTATTVYAQGGAGNPKLIAWDKLRKFLSKSEFSRPSNIGNNVKKNLVNCC